MDDISDKFSKLCDFFWRLDWPKTPDDGFFHTSDVCRERAHKVLEILGLADEMHGAAEEHLATLPPEAIKRMAEYIHKNQKAKKSPAYKKKMQELAEKRRKDHG